MRILLFISMLLPCLGSGQNIPRLDSLKSIVENSKHDSTRIKAYDAWSDEISGSDSEKDIELNSKIIELCNLGLVNSAKKTELNFFKKYQASAYNKIGLAYSSLGEFKKASLNHKVSYSLFSELSDLVAIAKIENNLGIVHYYLSQFDSASYYFQASLETKQKLRDTLSIGATLNNLGSVFLAQGNFINAVKYYTQSLKRREKNGDMEGVAISYGNLGLLYSDQGDHQKAISLIEKSLEIDRSLGNMYGVSSNLINLGIEFKEQGKLEDAMKCYEEGLIIAKDLGYKAIQSSALNNIGQIHYLRDETKAALKIFQESLVLKKLLNDAKGESRCLNFIANVYLKNGNWKLAELKAYSALEISNELGLVAESMNSSNTLYLCYKELGEYDQALIMYEQYITLRDSIKNESNQKEVIRQEYKYEYEKQAAADSVKAAEAAKVKDAQLTAQRAENVRQQQQAYYLYGGLALALLFGGFIFNRFRVTSKQKKVIEVQKIEVEKQREFADSQRQLAEEQKEVVEEKNREIIDSINYAKRLQEAILPPQKLVREYLQQSFILYKPKDIVAGDFYWMETVGDTVYFAAADCTGHGVPGAMVSVVCSNALSKALIEENVTDVGKLLDRTRELVIERFGRSEENIQDGMDIALCALNTKTNELHYAGANNPLWIIRKGATEVEETKADKQPIGKYDKEDPFTTHSIELQKGDTLYIFSDGYPDQFGGDKGKKYKTGAMKKFLLFIQDKDLPTQRQLLNDEFENWKGNLEQIDDVCVIGVRV